MIASTAEQNRAVLTETWEFSVEGGLIVARPDVPCLFCLNQTARVIWCDYCKTASQDHAACTLAETFGISRDLAVQDVIATLKGWADTGLLGETPHAACPQWDGRHGKASVIAYCAIESTIFLLLTDSAEVAAELAPRLEGLNVEACEPQVTIAIWRSVDDFFAIVAEEECIEMVQGAQAARAVLFQELVCRAQTGREWLALLHAGACGFGGRCVLFPASSYSGKSTLAAALMASGFALYGDDFVGVSVGSLHVPAMPFAIAARHGSWNILQSWIPNIEDRPSVKSCGEHFKFLPVPRLHEAVAGEAVAIVFTEWAQDGEISERRLTTIDALGRLGESGFWVRHDRGSIGAFLAWIERLPKSTLRYGDLSHAVARVGELASITAVE